MSKTLPSGKPFSLAYGNRIIRFHLTFSDRKTLGITVLPDQSISVKAPSGKALGDVLEKVRKHASWIIKQVDHFERFQPLQPPRQYISGETILYLGRQYRLKVLQDKNESVKLVGRFLYVRSKNKENRRETKILVESWYEFHARSLLKKRLDHCLKKASIHGISGPIVRYMRMLRRWGSCTKNNIVTLNTELVKVSPYCIDYVITHELCHTKQKYHDPKFYRLLSALMPDWQRRKLLISKSQA